MSKHCFAGCRWLCCRACASDPRRLPVRGTALSAAGLAVRLQRWQSNFNGGTVHLPHRTQVMSLQLYVLTGDEQGVFLPLGGQGRKRQATVLAMHELGELRLFGEHGAKDFPLVGLGVGVWLQD